MSDKDPPIPNTGRGKAIQALLARRQAEKQSVATVSSSGEGGVGSEGDAASGGGSSSSKLPSAPKNVQDLLREQRAQARSGESSGPPVALGRAQLLERLKMKAANKTPVVGGSSVVSKPSSSAESSTAQAKAVDDIVEPVGKLALANREEEESAPVIMKGEKGRTLNLTANMIRLRFKDEGLGVFEYEVKFNPPLDSRRDRCRIINQLSQHIGSTKTFDGVLLALPKRLPDYRTHLHGTTESGTSTEVIITLKKKKKLGECIQLFNILFRKIMEELKMVEMKRNFYNPSEKVMVPQHKLEIWPGFVTAVHELEGGLMLKCDVSHKVLRNQTAYSVLADCRKMGPEGFHAKAEKALIGEVILSKYNNKNYKVDDIDFKQSPKSTFQRSTGEEISYMDYYKTTYNIDIKDPNQPLLVNRVKKKTVDEQEVTKLLCLIPELCCMTGLTDTMRSDFRVMKDVAQYTRITPNQRHQALRIFLKNIRESPEASEHLNKWGLRIDEDTIRLEGRKIESGKLHMGRGLVVTVNPKADWTRDITNNHSLTTVDIKKWHVVYCERNKAVAEGFITAMCKQGPRMGLAISRPSVASLPNDRTETYLMNLKEVIRKDLQLVVIIVPLERDDRYNAVKRLCNVDMPIPSQVINARTISQEKKLNSVVQKVILQINCKLGGELWGLGIPIKNLMIVGIDVYHDPARQQGSVAGVVASMNSSYSTWFSTCAFQAPGQEFADLLRVSFEKSMQKYYAKNKTYPDKIIVYRDGVSDGQLDLTVEHEVKQFKDSFSSVGDEYQPGFAFVVVQKRINDRFFNLTESGFDNPPPGSILDHTVVKRNWYDFLLVSQCVNQGTVSPSHYIVVDDTTAFPVDTMQKISYCMTHMYFNWPGTVKVPAPCQYAHKLAYQVGENTRKIPDTSLEDRLFYL